MSKKEKGGLLKSEIQYHIQMKKGDVADFVILPGDPGRVEFIADHFDTAKVVADNREYKTMTGKYKGRSISVTSTGIGCPSTAIAVEELANIGAKTFVRMGTSGAMQDFTRVGDKVIQTRNNYDKETLNGDIGKVIEISTDPGKVIIQFSGQRTVSYEPGELDEISPGFAITVHKSQGSEFPCVVIPVSTQHFLLLQRNLLYTAITRGSQVVVLVGQKKAAAMAVKNIDTKERYRGLLQRLAD